MSGYTSPPPPGEGGVASQPFFDSPAGHWRLSGWWRRVGAALIDGLVIALIAFALLALSGVVAGIGFGIGDTTGVIALILGFMFWALCATVAALLYAPVMMYRTNGQTLGKMAFGIRVVRAKGQPISFGWAVLREVVVRWLLFNAVLGSVTFGLAPLLDILWPLWDEENRALHDFIVDSRVIRSS